MNSRPYRYPGIKPFDRVDEDIYFGRDEDINRLTQLISLEKMTTLFSKSGMGKTSLLNAGVAPVISKLGYELVFIRFRSAIENDNTPLSDFFIEQIKGNADVLPLLDELTPENNNLFLWQNFKKFQQKFQEDKTFLLIFDQFEEFFTHPQERMEAFMRDFSELYHTTVPQRFRDELVKRNRENPNFAKETEIRKIFSPINIKVVLSIRIDRLSELNKLTSFFPNIMANAIELQPLRREDAEKAIREPARKLGNFSSPKFEYSPESIDSIFKALFDRNEKFVECFQLQIVCQFIEQIVQKKMINVVNPEDFGDLRKVYDNYYLQQISHLPIEEQVKARILLEEVLILENGLRHLKHEKDLEAVAGVDTELLNKLVNLHLVRKEIVMEQTYYELSHDQFVKTLQKAKKIRHEDELRKRFQAEYEERRKRENLMKNFEEARQLDKIDRDKMKLMRKETLRKQAKIYYDHLKRTENRNLIKGLLSIGTILVIVFILIGASIYGFITGRQYQNKMNSISHEINEMNNEFKKRIETGSQITTEEANRILNRYNELEKLSSGK
jgi:hypothetical protein